MTHITCKLGTRSSTKFCKPSEIPVELLKDLYRDCQKAIHSTYGTILLRSISTEDAKNEPSKFT